MEPTILLKKEHYSVGDTLLYQKTNRLIAHPINQPPGVALVNLTTPIKQVIILIP